MTREIEKRDIGTDTYSFSYHRLLANMHIDDRDPSHIEAIDLIRSAGYIVLATPVEGLFEPRVVIGGHRYEGIEAMREFVGEIKNDQANSTTPTE